MTADRSADRKQGPPHSLEAEQGVLGCLLIDNAAWSKLNGLRAADFWAEPHREIFSALASVLGKGGHADAITVHDRLKSSGKADEVGGMAYLNNLTSSVTSAAALPTYAKIVRDHAERRQVIALARGAQESAQSGRDAAAIAAQLIERVGQVVAPRPPPLREQVEADTPRPLPPELLPVEPFRIDALPDAFRPWVADVADLMQCPPDFIAVPMLVAAASLVARRVAVRPKQRNDWTERANLWALIVGRPGFMKSPAMDRALYPLTRMEARSADAFNAKVARYEAKEMAEKLRAGARVKAAQAKLKDDNDADVSALLKADAKDEAPTRVRYIVNDATYEKLGELLRENPDGVLSVRDEMRALLLHLTREEQAQARGFFIQAWSGGAYTFDRIQRGTLTIPDLRLSMVGGIQPGPLSDLIRDAHGASDGMLERFLIAWPDAAPDWRDVDRWPDSDARRLVWECFDRLDGMRADDLHAERDMDPNGDPRGLPFLRLDDDARDAFGEWHRDMMAATRGTDDECLAGVLSKFAHHVPALALTLHVIDGGTGPVTLPATLRALALAEYFESHARRAHVSSQRLVVRAARAILAKAKAGDLPELFTARDVHQGNWSGLTDRAIVGEALDMLAARGWLTEATIDTGGRPKVLYGLTEGARRG